MDDEIVSDIEKKLTENWWYSNNPHSTTIKKQDATENVSTKEKLWCKNDHNLSDLTKNNPTDRSVPFLFELSKRKDH